MAIMPSTISGRKCIGPKWKRSTKQVAELQKEEGVRVIKHAHMLGFLDPDLPKRGKSALETTEAIS